MSVILAAATIRSDVSMISFVAYRVNSTIAAMGAGRD
jgi:hypothetical protein